LQLTVLAPVIAVLGVSLSAPVAQNSVCLTMVETPATGEPCDASLWVLDAPVTSSISLNRPVQPASLALEAARLPPPNVAGLPDEERLVTTDLAGSAPRSPRAPPVR
jgi:hypothetical protein